MTLTIEPGLNGHPVETKGGPSKRRGLIDNVDVAVEAYLGHRVMTVAELSALDTGAVIALDASLNARIELRVNGVAIAAGELVAVGDKFAVRITSVAP